MIYKRSQEKRCSLSNPHPFVFCNILCDNWMKFRRRYHSIFSWNRWLANNFHASVPPHFVRLGETHHHMAFCFSHACLTPEISVKVCIWALTNGNGVEVANNNECANNNYLGCCWLQVATKVLSAWELSTHVFNIHIKHSHSAHPLFIHRAQQVCCVFVAHDGIHSIRTLGKLNANVLWNCSIYREWEYKLANWTYFVQSII
jgi:hypothetical protein